VGALERVVDKTNKKANVFVTNTLLVCHSFNKKQLF